MPINRPIAHRSELFIAAIAAIGIGIHLLLRFSVSPGTTYETVPLIVVLVLGGIPLVFELLRKLVQGNFGSDLLAGISIITSVILGEYLAGSIVVLMLSGGETLESYAVRSASSVLEALANRTPTLAHIKIDSKIIERPLSEIQIGELLIVLPHEVCPIDGTVIEGNGVMDESYLTGEPYQMSKAPGSTVFSGAINGQSSLTIRADKLAVDSRYAKIMQVMQSSSQNRPRIRRLADRLGSIYTPVAIALGLVAWIVSGEAIRFLAVMVVATPCPLLIAIPVSIIGSISLAARRAIIIRDPSVLETIDTCRTAIFDKTGTLTYGKPLLVNQDVAAGFDPNRVLSLVASMEQYSKHPLAAAILAAAVEASLALESVAEVRESPGQGMGASVGGHKLRVTNAKHFQQDFPEQAAALPPPSPGMQCVIVVDNNYAATYQFRDAPRAEGALFVSHLKPKHRIEKAILLSGDRLSEVEYLAAQVGIQQIYAGKSPEEKVEIVRQETELAPTLFVGDGINDAPALMIATVGIAFGQNSDVTTEAAGAVILDSSLEKVDELLHISRRMRRIALQSAVGGMALSVIGMLIAAVGYLPPVAGAIFQEVIDVAAVLNALRVAIPPKTLSDF